MTEYPELYVLRHGETYWNREGRIQGRLHSDLTPKGQDHARHQGKLLLELGLLNTDLPIFVSPQGRALQTAELALAQIGRNATPDDRLVELCCGAYEGYSLRQLEERNPGTLKSREADMFAWYMDVEGGETESEIEQRVRSFLDDLDGPAIIVSHGITTRFLRGAWLGLNRQELRKLPGDHGCIYHLSNGVHRVIS